MDFFKLAGDAIHKIGHDQGSGDNKDDGGFKLPPFVLEKIDQFLDEKKKDLKPQLTQHIATFQADYLNQLEKKVYDIFDHVVDLDDLPSGNSSRSSEPKERGFGEFLENVGSLIADGIEKHFNPQEIAQQYVPQLKQKASEMLTSTHDGLSDKFAEVAVSHMKSQIRGNLSKSDLGSLVFEGIGENIGNFFSGLKIGDKREIEGEKSRELGGNDQQERGFNFDIGKKKGVEFLAKLFLEKLQSGLKGIEEQTKAYFREELAKIEKFMWEKLPDDIKGPLAVVMGMDNDNRGFDDELGGFVKKFFEMIQQKVQKIAKEILDEGHKLLEDRAIKSVHGVIINTVESTVNQYVKE